MCSERAPEEHDAQLTAQGGLRAGRGVGGDSEGRGRPDPRGHRVLAAALSRGVGGVCCGDRRGDSHAERSAPVTPPPVTLSDAPHLFQTRSDPDAQLHAERSPGTQSPRHSRPRWTRVEGDRELATPADGSQPSRRAVAWRAAVCGPRCGSHTCSLHLPAWSLRDASVLGTRVCQGRRPFLYVVLRVSTQHAKDTSSMSFSSGS